MGVPLLCLLVHLCPLSFLACSLIILISSRVSVSARCARFPPHRQRLRARLLMFAGAVLLWRTLRTCHNRAAQPNVTDMAGTQSTDAQQTLVPAADQQSGSAGWPSATSQVDTLTVAQQ